MKTKIIEYIDEVYLPTENLNWQSVEDELAKLGEDFLIKMFQDFIAEDTVLAYNRVRALARLITSSQISKTYKLRPNSRLSFVRSVDRIYILNSYYKIPVQHWFPEVQQAGKLILKFINSEALRLEDLPEWLEYGAYLNAAEERLSKDPIFAENLKMYPPEMGSG